MGLDGVLRKGNGDGLEPAKLCEARCTAASKRQREHMQAAAIKAKIDALQASKSATAAPSKPSAPVRFHPPACPAVRRASARRAVPVECDRIEWERCRALPRTHRSASQMRLAL